MQILFHAHSGVRYLVWLAGLIAVVYAAIGLFGRKPYDRGASITMQLFVGLLDVQVLLGIILVFLRPFYPALTWHIVMISLSAVVDPVSTAINPSRPAERKSWPLQFGDGVLSMLSIIAGIMAIGRSIL